MPRACEACRPRTMDPLAAYGAARSRRRAGAARTVAVIAGGRVVGVGRVANRGPERTGADAARRAAFFTFTEARPARAYRLAAVVLRDPVDAEDAVHDAGVQAWTHWSDLRDETRADAWFDRIIVNECRARLRCRRVVPLNLAQPPDRQAPDMCGALAARHDLHEALARLDPDHRIAWLSTDGTGSSVHLVSLTDQSRADVVSARPRSATEAAADAAALALVGDGVAWVAATVDAFGNRLAAVNAWHPGWATGRAVPILGVPDWVAASDGRLLVSGPIVSALAQTRVSVVAPSALFGQTPMGRAGVDEDLAGRIAVAAFESIRGPNEIVDWETTEDQGAPGGSSSSAQCSTPNSTRPWWTRPR